MLELYGRSEVAIASSDIKYYADAEYFLEKIIHKKTALLGRNYAGCSFDLYNLGLINNALQNYERARRFIIRALQIQRKEKPLRRAINVGDSLEKLALLRKNKQSSYAEAQRVAQGN